MWRGLRPRATPAQESGGDEVVGFEDLEVALGVMVAFGAVDDGLGGGVPSDFLEGGVFAKASPPKEGMAQKILGKAFATGGVVGGYETTICMA